MAKKIRSLYRMHPVRIYFFVMSEFRWHFIITWARHLCFTVYLIYKGESFGITHFTTYKHVLQADLIRVVIRRTWVFYISSLLQIDEWNLLDFFIMPVLPKCYDLNLDWLNYPFYLIYLEGLGTWASSLLSIKSL